MTNYIQEDQKCQKMYARQAESCLRELAQVFPIVCIMGPRQSGKTTLAKHIFTHLPYVSLEDLFVRDQARLDPKSFLAQYDNGAIFDEVQHVPELFSYLQIAVDTKDQNGRFVLTGSQHFAMNERISQSLAGRVGIVTLFPLSMFELQSECLTTPELIVSGGYPRLHKEHMKKPWQFYSAYVQTYLERDVRQLQNIVSLDRFQDFMRLCAGRVGQLLNVSNLSNDLGITTATVQNWLSILTATYVLFFLQPFHRNFNKRIIKSPKLYFCDTGLVSYLLNIESAEQIATHFAKGALYENLAILELMKLRHNQGIQPSLYFWQNQAGHEVDCIAEWGGQLQAFEVKAGATIQKDMFKGLDYLQKLEPAIKRYLVYGGNDATVFLDKEIVPIQQIARAMGYTESANRSL